MFYSFMKKCICTDIWVKVMNTRHVKGVQQYWTCIISTLMGLLMLKNDDLKSLYAVGVRQRISKKWRRCWNLMKKLPVSLLQIVLCQNNIRHQSHMNRVVAHELIHAFDHCRAHVDWFKNVKHLACSEVS